MKLLTMLLCAMGLHGQVINVRHKVSTPATPASFVQACTPGYSGSTHQTSISTGAINTTAGNTIVAAWGSQIGSCGVFNNPINTPTISDTAGNSYIPVPPNNGNGAVIGVKLDTGGSSLTTATWTASGGGCSTLPTVLTNTITGGVATSLQISSVGAGCNTVPSLSATCTGAGCVPPTAHFTAMGVTTGATSCFAAWYAPGITTQAGNVITVSMPSGNPNYHSIGAVEIANAPVLKTSSSASASASSLATGNMTTSAASLLVLFSRVEATSQTWTAGTTGFCAASACIIPTGYVGSGANSYMSAEYAANSSPVSAQAAGMSSAANNIRNVIGAIF